MNILIVEDDPIINQNIKEGLVAEGYVVEVAFDGLMAEKILHRKNFNCIILHINLPHKMVMKFVKSFVNLILQSSSAHCLCRTRRHSSTFR